MVVGYVFPALLPVGRRTARRHAPNNPPIRSRPNQHPSLPRYPTCHARVFRLRAPSPRARIRTTRDLIGGEFDRIREELDHVAQELDPIREEPDRIRKALDPVRTHLHFSPILFNFVLASGDRS